MKEKKPVSVSKSPKLEWKPDDPFVNGSKVFLFDGLLVMKCYKTGNGDWASLAFGVETEDIDCIDFGELFATEYEAREAAENWFFQKIKGNYTVPTCRF